MAFFGSGQFYCRCSQRETEARGVGLGVGQISKDIQRDDLFNVGEWSRARALIFQVAQKLSGSSKAQTFLQEIVQSASSYEFCPDILFYCRNRDRNHILTEWSYIKTEDLDNIFIGRLKKDFAPGGSNSILDLGESGALAVLFGWRNAGEPAASEVTNYLQTQIEANPSRLGKLAKWFFPHELIGDSNKDALMKLLSPTNIRDNCKRFGENVWKSDEEKNAVERMIRHLPPERTLLGSL